MKRWPYRKLRSLEKRNEHITSEALTEKYLLDPSKDLLAVRRAIPSCEFPRDTWRKGHSEESDGLESVETLSCDSYNSERGEGEERRYGDEQGRKASRQRGPSSLDILASVAALGEMSAAPAVDEEEEKPSASCLSHIAVSETAAMNTSAVVLTKMGAHLSNGGLDQRLPLSSLGLSQQQ